MAERPPSLEELGYETLPVPEGFTQDEFLRQLRSEPGVVSADPDARVYAAATPNDPFFERDQLGYLGSIGVPSAWDLAVGREEIVVAVLDSGVDLAHPDIAPRLWVNTGEVPGNNIDDSGSGCIDDRHGCRFVTVTPENQSLCGYAPEDGVHSGNVWDDNGRPGTLSHSHGTMVSGIVGAAGNNGQGIAGVGWNVRLMIVKVLDCGSPTGGTPGGQMSDVARGIDYARRMGADVINLSLASSPGNQGADIPMLRDAIAAAETEGVIVVAAAGNHGLSSDPRPGYPAAYTQYSNLVAVGASNWTQGQTWIPFSAYGPSVDLAAPGNQITSTVRSDLGLAVPYGTSNQGGTSFATPLVSGMFALMKSANSRLGHEAYIQIARDTATPATEASHGGNWAGAGIINVREAVARIPMLITGFALHDWVDVQPGVSVSARVGGRVCGQANTFAVGVVARFELTVDPDAVTSGCGAPGRTVDLFVGASRARTSIPWGGPTEELLHTGKEVSTVSPDPGPVVVQVVGTGWNNLAHLEATSALPGALAYLPPSWEAVFSWDPFESAFRRALRTGPTYTRDWEIARRYDAFWVYSPSSANAASVNPNPSSGRTISLREGWNNFVFTGTSEQMATALSAIDGKYDGVYRFNNESGQWESYVPDRSRFLNSLGGLLIMRVYWIHMTESALLTMP
jgi:subtilisin family serine protease